MNGEWCMVNRKYPLTTHNSQLTTHRIYNSQLTTHDSLITPKKIIATIKRDSPMKKQLSSQLHIYFMQPKRALGCMFAYLNAVLNLGKRYLSMLAFSLRIRGGDAMCR